MSAADTSPIVIAGETENADLTSDQPELSSAEFAGKKLPPPAGDVVPPYPDRPQIVIADGESPAILDAAELIAAQHFYSRGTSLVRITAARNLPDALKCPTDTAARRERPDDQRVILDCAPSYLATEITRRADVKKFSGSEKSYRKTDFPEKYARALLERKTWPHVRPLDALVRAPFVREDGSICDQPGYDAESRCFADLDPDEFYELPDDISKEAAAAALEKLLAPFDQFPYESPAARSAFAAHILTEAARIATPCVPVFWYAVQDGRNHRARRGTGGADLAEQRGGVAQGDIRVALSGRPLYHVRQH
jgi:putative DNA primase/helicase